VGLAEGLDLERAAARACCAGAFAVQRLGVIDGLPTRAELDDFIATKGA
jgi:sugar/nucleoside kinase (ribokinase family)